MQPIQLPSQECQRWLNTLGAAYLSASEAWFDTVAADMARLGNDIDWAELQVCAAAPKEERLYLLAQLGPDGPALYLVSDGHGVTSPAHEHNTWAIIVGLRGIESNILYEVTSREGREARHNGARNIGVGDFIVLTESAVHATQVIGTQATFHLHLYGKPLHSLPAFEDRVFNVPTSVA